MKQANKQTKEQIKLSVFFYYLALTILMFFSSVFKEKAGDLFAQGFWTRKADMTGDRSEAVGFSVGSKGYIGLGYVIPGVHGVDLWEWDQGTNLWTQKVNFTGAGRYGAAAFSIADKGYVGTGNNAGTIYKDFYEYNPSTNQWTQKADYGGDPKYRGVGFSINSKGYIGCGWSSLTGTNVKDFWEYNPSTNQWTQITDFPGTAREGVAAFTIGTKSYVGTGYSYDLDTYYTDFYEYDQFTGQWTQKADFPGAARGFAVAFAINGKGYVGTGWNGTTYYNDVYEYDPSTNQWNPVATAQGEFGSGKRWSAVGFSIGSKGYLGTGDWTFSSEDFWEYTPSTVSIPERTSGQPGVQAIQVYANPGSGYINVKYKFDPIYSTGRQQATAKFVIVDIMGRNLAFHMLKQGENELNILSNKWSNGIYFYCVSANNEIVTNGKLMIIN